MRVTAKLWKGLEGNNKRQDDWPKHVYTALKQSLPGCRKGSKMTKEHPETDRNVLFNLLESGFPKFQVWSQHVHNTNWVAVNLLLSPVLRGDLGELDLGMGCTTTSSATTTITCKMRPTVKKNLSNNCLQIKCCFRQRRTKCQKSKKQNKQKSFLPGGKSTHFFQHKHS